MNRIKLWKVWRRRLPGGPRGNGSDRYRIKIPTDIEEDRTRRLFFLFGRNSDALFGSESSDMGGPRTNFESFLGGIRL